MKLVLCPFLSLALPPTFSLPSLFLGLLFPLLTSISPGPLAVFTDLPHSSLLTLNMDTPHSWLVEAVWSPHDLDNIHLEGVERGVHGEFELEHILVEGLLMADSSCFLWIIVHMLSHTHTQGSVLMQPPTARHRDWSISWALLASLRGLTPSSWQTLATSS